MPRSWKIESRLIYKHLIQEDFAKPGYMCFVDLKKLYVCALCGDM